MTEKTEWELVDAPSPGTRPTLRDVLKALLGPHWRWKIAGAAVVASVALALLLTLTGVAALLLVAVAILSIGVGKLRHWLGRGRRAVRRF